LPSGSVPAGDPVRIAAAPGHPPARLPGLSLRRSREQAIRGRDRRSGTINHRPGITLC